MIKQKLLDLILELLFNEKKFSVYIVTLLVLFITNVKAENAITFLNLEYVLNNSVSGKVILNEINLLKKQMRKILII